MKKIGFENLSEWLKQIKKESLICPNCLRLIPCKEHRKGKGCKWCMKP